MDCCCPPAAFPPIPPAFPLTEFLARFTEFSDSEKYPLVKVQNCGQRAMMHITPDAEDMPMDGHYREYGLFLMTAHILTLENADDDDGNGVNGLSGIPFKATVGSVTIENTKPNSFTSDDWTYWLSQTKYGRELLAYLDTRAQAIYLNTECDSVRDLL